MPSMSFNARKVTDISSVSSHCVVVPLFQGDSLPASAKALDKALEGALKKAISVGDFSGKAGQTLLIPGNGKLKRVLAIGAGSESKLDRSAIMALCRSLYAALKPLEADNALIDVTALKLKPADREWTLEYLARTLVTSDYRYEKTVSKPKPRADLKKIVVNVGKSPSVASAKRALETGRLTGEGINEARELGNLPGNYCTPTFLASRARSLSRKHKTLRVSILDEKKMRELKMGSLLSVSAGSREEARMIIMDYRGGKKDDAPYVLVGKGITFDSGGISLKPGAKMDEMKFDMCGAASVFGTMEAIVGMQLPLNVVGVVAAAENMPSGTATKPGDVVTSMSGKTIEVLNTDAEGRLVLCDALTYVQRYKPAAIIDIATLTGACVVALGAHAAGLFTNDDDLAEQLLAAGVESHDRAWQLPLWDDYQKQINTPFADIANIGSPGGGSITAACFLSRFAEDQSWAHLDIAGAAWSASPKGATGRPVALLTRYLRDRAADAE